MRRKNPMRRKSVSWKTKLGAALGSMMFAGVWSIFLSNSHSDDEVWMVSGFIVFLTMIAAMSSDVSWKMKLGVFFAAGLLVGVPAILLTQIYPVNAIWMMPAVIGWLAGLYASFASGIVRASQGTDAEMTFDSQRNAGWKTGNGLLIALPGSPDDPCPAVIGKFHSHAEALASRSRSSCYDD